MKKIGMLLIVLLCLIGVPAFAEEPEEPEKFSNGSYVYTLLEDGTVEICDYLAGGSEVTIPDQIDGHKVTSIGEKAFCSNSNLKNIIFPDTITKIGTDAFFNDDNLETITLSGNLLSIGDSAFSFCESLRGLTSIILPRNLTSIGSRAFVSCENLVSITIPDSVTSIEEGTFGGCNNLTITVPRDSYAAEYCKENGLKYTYPDANDWLND